MSTTEAMTETATTSSIGACWPPRPATQERIRGFYADHILDVHDTRGLDEFEEAYLATQELLGSEGISRISLRAFATVAAIRELEQDGIPVEAAMPFGCPLSGPRQPHMTTPEEAAAEHHVVYVGENTPGRRSTQLWTPPSAEQPHVITTREQLAWPHSVVPPVEFREIAGRARDEHMELFPQFSELLAPFGYTPDEVQDILVDPNIHIVFAITPEGRVVSSAMAELGQFDVRGAGTVHMAEITEAATLPEYRGAGIYRRASGLLLCHLGMVSQDLQLRQGQHLNVIFGESNLHMPAVVAAAMRNGRWPVSSLVRSHYGEDLFGADVRREQGRQVFGVLEQNFRVNDGAQHEDPYNDFMLTPLSYGGHIGIGYAASS